MKQICILPEGLYGSFRAGNVPDYPNPSSVNCLGVVRRDEKTKEVKSIGIFSFKKRAQVLDEVLKRINRRFPLNVSV